MTDFLFRSRRRARRRNGMRGAALALLGGAASACTGPALHVSNPAKDRVFLDGVETAAREVPFRYYGETRWDAQPKDVDGFADWNRLPASGTVAMPAPVSGWLFPADLPLELVARVLFGRGDHTAQVELPPASTERVATTEIPPESLTELRSRARAARGER